MSFPSAGHSIFFSFQGHDYEEENFQVTRRYRPLSIDELVRRTKFSKKEIQLIYRGFKQECPSGEKRFPDNKKQKSTSPTFFRSHQWRKIQEYLFTVFSISWWFDLCAFYFLNIRHTFVWFNNLRRVHYRFVDFVPRFIRRSTSMDFLSLRHEQNGETNRKSTIFIFQDDWKLPSFSLTKDFQSVVYSVYALLGTDSSQLSGCRSVEEHAKTIFEKFNRSQEGFIIVEDFVNFCLKVWTKDKSFLEFFRENNVFPFPRTQLSFNRSSLFVTQFETNFPVLERQSNRKRHYSSTFYPFYVPIVLHRKIIVAFFLLFDYSTVSRSFYSRTDSKKS